MSEGYVLTRLRAGIICRSEERGVGPEDATWRAQARVDVAPNACVSEWVSDPPGQRSLVAVRNYLPVEMSSGGLASDSTTMTANVWGDVCAASPLAAAAESRRFRPVESYASARWRPTCTESEVRVWSPAEAESRGRIFGDYPVANLLSALSMLLVERFWLTREIKWNWLFMQWNCELTKYGLRDRCLHTGLGLGAWRN